MLDIPKIRAVLDTASRWDMDLEQFACWSHAHLFNPVLPLEELEAWEEQMQVTLPVSTATTGRKHFVMWSAATSG